MLITSRNRIDAEWEVLRQRFHGRANKLKVALESPYYIKQKRKLIFFNIGTLVLGILAMGGAIAVSVLTFGIAAPLALPAGVTVLTTATTKCNLRLVRHVFIYYEICWNPFYICI